MLTAFLLLCVGLLQSQAQYNKQDLIGTWKLSLEHVIEGLPTDKKAAYDKMSDQEKRQMILYLQQMLGNIRIEFEAQGKTKVNLAGNNEKSGTWKLTGDQLKVTTNEGKVRIMKILSLSRQLFRFESQDAQGKKIYMTMVPVK